MENNDQPKPGGERRRGRMLAAIFTLLGVFALGLFLGRIWTEKKEGAEIPTATEQSEEASPPSNQIKLSAESIKNGGIETDVVRLHSFQQKLEVTGRLAVNEDNSARVGTFVTGRVRRVLATVGDHVKIGQALIYLHSHELLDARANEEKARAGVIEREKALAYVKAELERADRLLEAKAISRREQAQAAANVAAAAAELEQSRAELKRASEWLEHLTVPHDSHDDIVIYAPISGVILKRNVTLGTVVDEASDLMVIANLRNLWAIADVPQQQAAQVRIGQLVEVEVGAFADSRIKGRVSHIGEALNPETRTVQVRCVIDNPRGDLRPEMYAKISLSSQDSQQLVAAPSQSIQEVEGERVVFLALGDGAFEKRAVQTGREQDGLIEITNGLEPGQRIVTRGGFFLKSEFLKGSLSKE